MYTRGCVKKGLRLYKKRQEKSGIAITTGFLTKEIYKKLKTKGDEMFMEISIHRFFWYILYSM